MLMSLMFSIGVRPFCLYNRLYLRTKYTELLQDDLFTEEQFQLV